MLRFSSIMKVVFLLGALFGKLNLTLKLSLCYKQDMEELMKTDRPDWQSVMLYVSQIYKYFET